MLKASVGVLLLATFVVSMIVALATGEWRYLIPALISGYLLGRE